MSLNDGKGINVDAVKSFYYLIFENEKIPIVAIPVFFNTHLHVFDYSQSFPINLEKTFLLNRKEVNRKNRKKENSLEENRELAINNQF